jgi:Phytoene dehydrogenase and related proteins
MNKYDVVVIGAGISGLLSPLAISKENKSVLVLEIEEYIGGVCRSYEVDGYRVDTGPHTITRLERGPLRELMDRYFDVILQFVPFWKCYVRTGGKIKPFPWSINAWMTFSLLPTTDRLLLIATLFNILYILPANISVATRRFLDWIYYLMVGTSIENAPVLRFIDNKTHNPSPIPCIGELYDLLKEYIKNLTSIKRAKSLTIWVGLKGEIFTKYGSEMWLDSEPYAWFVPTSNYDSSLAPKGKQLVSFAFTRPSEYNGSMIRKKAFDEIIKTIPHIDENMIQYQELIHEKASWGINSGFGYIIIPIKNLYCVGTDTEKRSVGG